MDSIFAFTSIIMSDHFTRKLLSSIFMQKSKLINHCLWLTSDLSKIKRAHKLANLFLLNMEEEKRITKQLCKLNLYSTIIVQYKMCHKCMSGLQIQHDWFWRRIRSVQADKSIEMILISLCAFPSSMIKLQQTIAYRPTFSRSWNFTHVCNLLFLLTFYH